MLATSSARAPHCAVLFPSTSIHQALQHRVGLLPLLIVALSCRCLAAQQVAPTSGEQHPLAALARLRAQCPSSAEQFVKASPNHVRDAASAVEAWTAALSWNRDQVQSQQVLAVVDRLIDAKRQVDQQLTATLKLRSRFVQLDQSTQHVALRHYLDITATLIDLSGRIRYTMRDKLDNASFDLEPDQAAFDRLLETLAEHRVGIGAVVTSYVLFDPPPEEGDAFPAVSKAKQLRLIARCRQLDLVGELADFLKEPGADPELLVAAAATLWKIGVPQPSLPGEQRDEVPPPPVTAEQVLKTLQSLDRAKLRPPIQTHYDRLLEQLRPRAKSGVEEDEYPVGPFSVRPGDWLLMRNPSPYNHFTDLAPGLFTHVGVVAAQRGKDGIRRFVIVDLTERGERVPATNVEAYLARTLQYVFVRHQDPKVQAAMGDAAEQIIGNPTQFDLTFRSDRIEALRGKPLRGQLINTYCAGLLLLCAQQTDAPREAFFPIPERPAGGHCLDNLNKLGLSIGERFVSPTSALLSPQMQIVGRREPMYSPDREVKESVYDHFGRSMVAQPLTPSPDLRQALRQKLAGLARYNPLLARALAKANNVSERLDLESAAKAAAAVETLDEIANQAMDEFLAARRALRIELPASGADPKLVREVAFYRQRHANLHRRWQSGELSPRELRIALVEYYRRHGEALLDQRFFPDPCAAR